MTETKPWWMSRTIWVGLATSILAILKGFGVIPEEIQEGIIEEIIMAVLGILAIIFRTQATTEIEPILPITTTK